MAIDLFEPRSRRTGGADLVSQPDLAFAARPLFLRLSDTLRRVTELLGECRAMRDRATRHARAWGVPALFFADRSAEAEWLAKQAEPAVFPEPFLSLLSSSFPKLRDAWELLPDLLDDALSLCGESIDVRRMARAVPGLRDAASAVPQAAELAGILGLIEEEVWLVIHPAARSGFRVVIEGVGDIDQLHVLLAERLTGDPSRGYLAGRRPDLEVAEACRETGRIEGLVATSRFQFYRPEALQSDGALPAGFDGSPHWHWGRESLGAVTQQHGERILLIGDPVHPLSWDVTRQYSRVRAEADVVEVLSTAEVEGWLRTRCPQYRPSALPIARAA